MNKISLLKAQSKISRLPSQIILYIYFFQLTALLLQLLFNAQQNYAFIFKIFLFTKLPIISDQFQYVFLGVNLLIVPLSIIWPKLVFTLKIYPYLLSIPFCNHALDSFNNKNIAMSIICVINILLNMIIVRICYFLYMSYSFSQTEDYLTDRNLWWFKIIYPYILIGINYFNQSLIGAIIIVIFSFMVLIKQIFEYNYLIKHQGYIQFSLFNIITIGIWSSYYYIQSKNTFETISFIFIFGIYFTLLVSDSLLKYIEHKAIYKTDLKTFKQCEDTVRYMFQVSNMYHNQNKFQKKYYGIIGSHFQNCLNVDSKYKNIDMKNNNQINNYFNELLLDILIKPNDNLTEQRIVLIYYFMQIINQPFRAYYQVTKLTKQKLSILNKIQVLLIVQEARQKLQVILKQKKAINQQLQLNKVEYFEKKLIQLEQKFANMFKTLIIFLEILLDKYVYVYLLEDSSNEINQRRSQIEQIIDELHKINPNSKTLIRTIRNYYKFFDIYYSKQSYYEKLRQQYALQQRFFHSQQKIIFDEDTGIITIDLVENQGKIQYITKNLADIFKITKEEIIGTNIQLYMPEQPGRYHQTILKNFIQKGVVRQLNTNRIFFGKSKTFFVFPLQFKIKLDTSISQHFRSTALIKKLPNKNNFILIDDIGKCQQISEEIYKQIFFDLFESDVYKIKQCDISKFIPQFYRSDMIFNTFYQSCLMIPEDDNCILFSNQINNKSNLKNSTRTTDILSKTTDKQQEQQKEDNKKQMFENFLKKVDFFKLKGYRIKYKMTKMETNYFTTNIIEIQNFKQYENYQNFYKRLFSQFIQICDYFDMDEEKTRIQNYLYYIKITQPEDYVMDDVLVECIIAQKQSPQFETTEDNFHDSCSNKSVEIEDQSIENLEELSVDQPSEKSTVSTVNYNINKKQLVIDAFKKTNEQDYKSIKLIIYFFVGFITLMKISQIVDKLTFVSYEKNQDISISYLQQLQSSFYYYVSYLQLIQLYQDQQPDKSIFYKHQLIKQQANFLSLFMQVQQLLNQNNNLINYDILYNNTNIYDQDIISTQINLNFIQLLNKISLEIGNEVILDKQFIRQNFQNINHIFNQIRDKYYSFKQTTIQYKQNYSLLFTLASEFCYLLFFVISVPIYIYYNTKRVKLLQFLAFFSAKTIKTQLTYLKQLEVKINDKQYNEYTKSLMFQQGNYTKNTNQKSQKTQLLKLSFNKTKNSKNKFIMLVMGFFLMYSILNFSIWIISYQKSQQSNFSLQSYKKINLLSIQTPLLVYVFMSNINGIIFNSNISDNSYKMINESIYYEILSDQYNINPKTQQIGEIIKFLVSGYQTSQNLLKTGYFDNVKAIYKIFWYLIQNNYTEFSSDQINKWMQQQYIDHIFQNFILLRKQISQIFQQIDNINQQSYKNYQILIILFIIGNVLITLVLGYFMQACYINEIYVMINSAQSIFRNLNVAILTENNYMLSYFQEKLKKN